MKDKRMRLLTALSVCCVPMQAAVYITELMPPSAGSGRMGNPAFVELYNSSDTLVGLDGWKIAVGNTEHHFGKGNTIAPNGTLCVVQVQNREGGSTSDWEGAIVRTERMDWTDGSLRLANASGRTMDSLSFAGMNLPIGTSLHRDSVELTHDGFVDLGDGRLWVGDATPGRVSGMTERRKSVFHFYTSEEDDTYTLTMSYDVRVLENSESEDEIFGMDEENSDLLPLSEYVLTRPTPVKTILYVRMTEPAYSGCRYTLQDASGKIVALGELSDTDEEQVDMTGMQPGTYVLHVEKDGASYPFKIQKK